MIIINGLTKSNQLLLMLLPSMFLAVIILISPLFGVLITPILIFLLVAFMNVQTALLLAIAITPILKDVVIFHISIVDLRIGEILWLLLSATFVLKYLAYGKIIVERFPITKFLILLILAHLLSVAVSNYPLVSLRETVQMLYLAMVFIVISNILQTRALIEKAVFMMVISAALFIGFGVFQTVTGQPPFPSIEVDAAGITVLKCGFKEQFTLFGGHLLKRTSSFFLGPVETAAYLVTILSLILSILLGKGLDLRKRIGLCMIYLPGMFLLLMTYSRAGLLVFLLSVLITAFLKGRYIACGIIITILVFLILANPLLKSRFLEIFLLYEGSTRSHFTLWLQSIIMFLHKPLFGYGAGTFPIESINVWLPHRFFIPGMRSDAHNMFLQTAAETGLIGIIALVGIVFTVVRCMWEGLRRRIEGYYNDILIGLFVAISANLLMNLTMNAYKVESFWIILAIVYAAARLALKEQEGLYVNPNVA